LEAPLKILLSRISQINGDWVVDDEPITFRNAEGDPAHAQARRWGEAWRAEDPENRCDVVENLPD
jgi:hypothetical protein